jgi:probable rRNA maturation factor
MSCAAHVQGGAQDRQFSDIIQRAAEAAMHQDVAGSCEVNIALVGEAKMRELNKRYAGTDETTDVLSFESGADDPDSGRTILGDIAICLPIARAQAERAGHALEAELALLTVHGVLHLVGYDHAEPADRRRMWERQTAVLHELGHAIESPPEAG